MTKAEAFFNGLKGKKVAFIGIGVSNERLISMFADFGAEVTLCDQKTLDQLSDYADMLKEKKIKLHLGPDYLENIEADMIIRTPGMYFFHEKLTEYRKNNAVITSEMELFFELCPAKIYAVTGSDGKTTTTTLISEILKKSGKKVFLGGNIGAALLPDVLDMKESDYCVVELSSFQLISMRRSPDVAVVTNITPNHLNVHGTMEEYTDAKRNLVLHQAPDSKTVLSFDNEAAKEFQKDVRGKLYFFSRKESVRFGAYLDEENNIVYSDGKEKKTLFSASEIRIPGIHNVENYLAAISAVYDEVDVSDIQYVAKNFGGVEHRIEFVRELDGVRYYNDSIATTPTRTRAGLYSFPRKVILIAGGYDKKIPFDEFGKIVCDRVATVILMGATADKIEKSILESGKEAPKILRAENMKNAVDLAKIQAENGDIVLFSPACASFDMYKNFEERGRHFKSLIREL